jgi:NADH-quinone oxidoreductase subunit L
LGFALGIFAIYFLFDSVVFDTIFNLAAEKSAVIINIFSTNFHALTIICLLLFVGAMGKSAQLGLHVWLPDAMEGPTPVSALIHAATMVTAGVFMVVRLSPLFEYSEVALAVVTVVGASTAIFAATVACVQNDIKRVIAYSTCSQLGYMFFALGVSAYSAGMFHLITHAFFKSLLFLGAGSVIHAMSDEQDMRKMGGLYKLIPVTYIFMWIGSLALAGIWPFSGFFSKDIILEAAWAAHSGVGQYAFWLGIAAAFLTAFYSWRLIILTFHGTPRADEKTLAHVHESPKVMILPLTVLALGALFVGVVSVDYFVGEYAVDFWKNSIFVLNSHQALANAHHVPIWVKFLPVCIGVAGIALA